MWFLDFRTRSVGGPVASTPMLYEGHSWRGHGLSALPPGPKAVTFVFHGYNNNREEGMAARQGFANAAVATVPSLAESRLVGILWPGDSFMGFLSYPTEEADADRTAAALSAELDRARLSPAPNCVAHSLGTRVALQTVTTLATWNSAQAWADQIILFAGAVDNDSLARQSRYARGVANANRVVNVASTADNVLRFAFPAGDWFAGLFSGGYTRTALGRSGPASSPRAAGHVLPFQVGHFDLGHGDYMGGGDKRQRGASQLAGHAIERVEPLQSRLVP